MKIFVTGILLLILCNCSSIPDSNLSVADRQLKCLAEAIHGEARGEPKKGKVFVGRVVLTRVRLGFAPNVCTVVYSKKQFAPRSDFNQESLNAAIEAQRRGPNGVTHFHSYSEKRNPDAAFSTSMHCQYKTKVGGHWGYYCNEGRTPASKIR